MSNSQSFSECASPVHQSICSKPIVGLNVDGTINKTDCLETKKTLLSPLTDPFQLHFIPLIVSQCHFASPTKKLFSQANNQPPPPHTANALPLLVIYGTVLWKPLLELLPKRMNRECRCRHWPESDETFCIDIHPSQSQEKQHEGFVTLSQFGLGRRVFYI